MSRRLDWRGLMRLGLGRLRLDPAAFWAMSPGELGAAVEALGGGVEPPPPLRALMAAYPDDARGDGRVR